MISYFDLRFNNSLSDNNFDYIICVQKMLTYLYFHSKLKLKYILILDQSQTVSDKILISMN